MNSIQTKSSQLDEIRRQISERNKSAGPPCPQCGKELTTRTTRFYDIEICEKGNCGHGKITSVGECCRDRRAVHVRHIISNGTATVRIQCGNCGKVSSNAIGGYSAEQKAKMPPLDQEARDRNDAEREEINRGYYLTLQQLRDTRYAQQRDEWWEQYKKYLEGPIWAKKRMEILKRDEYLCQCCRDALATQVHHKNYEFVDFLGSEPAFDLESICTPCHNRLERMKKSNRYKTVQQ